MSQESQYTPEIGKRICEAYANSTKGLRGVLDEHEDFPVPSAVYKWRQNHAEFEEMFARAKLLKLEMMAEDIVDTAMDEKLDANERRLIVDTKKWLLTKLMHKTYGDKLDVTSGGEAIATPAHMIDARVQSIIMQAQQRRAATALEQLDDNALKLLD